MFRSIKQPCVNHVCNVLMRYYIEYLDTCMSFAYLSLPGLVVVVLLCDISDFVSVSGSETTDSMKKTCERHVAGMCSCCSDFETKSRAAKRKVITISTFGG